MIKNSNLKKTLEQKMLYHASLDNSNNQLSILWNRDYSNYMPINSNDSVCTKAHKTMKHLGLDPHKTRFVVAHTQQYFRQYVKDRGYILYGNDPIVEKDRVIYTGTGRLQHPSDYCGTSINYTCPIINEDGQIWRCDVAMSRAFDIKDLKVANGLTYDELIKDEKYKNDFQKAIRLRRPQVMKISVINNNKYIPEVIMSRYDLPRKWPPQHWLVLKG